MVKEASDAGYELPAVFSADDVFRVFGYRTAEELDRFLSDCPRHYIRSYFAEIYMGSAEKAHSIRSNNDKYLYNKIVQAIQSAGIPVKQGKGGRQGKQCPAEKEAAGHRTKSRNRTMGRQQASSRAASAKLPGRHGKAEQDAPSPHAQPPLTSTLAPCQLSSLQLSKGMPAELCMQLPPPDLPQALAMQYTVQHQLINQLGAKLLATLAASGSAFQPPTYSLHAVGRPCSQIAADFGSSELVTDPACLLRNLCSSREGDIAMFSHGSEQLQAESNTASRQARSTAAVAEQLTHGREEAPTDSASRSTMGLTVQQWSPDCVSDGRRPLPAAAHKEPNLNTVTAAQSSPSGDSGGQTVAPEHGSMRSSPVSRSLYSNVPAARSGRGARKQATTRLSSAAMKTAPTRRGIKRRRRELSPPRKRWLSPCEDDALSAGSHEPETTSSFLALLDVAHMAQEQENVAGEMRVQV